MNLYLYHSLTCTYSLQVEDEHLKWFFKHGMAGANAFNRKWSQGLLCSYRSYHYHLHIKIRGLPRCKNLTRLSLFVSHCFSETLLFKMFCFLYFTSSVSFTGYYTEAKPKSGRIVVRKINYSFAFMQMASGRMAGHH